MVRSSSAKWLWHELDRVLRPALHGGATFDEAIAALRHKADELERTRDAGVDPSRWRRHERL